MSIEGCISQRVPLLLLFFLWFRRSSDQLCISGNHSALTLKSSYAHSLGVASMVLGCSQLSCICFSLFRVGTRFLTIHPIFATMFPIMSTEIRFFMEKLDNRWSRSARFRWFQPSSGCFGFPLGCWCCAIPVDEERRVPYLLLVYSSHHRAPFVLDFDNVLLRLSKPTISKPGS